MVVLRNASIEKKRFQSSSMVPSEFYLINQKSTISDKILHQTCCFGLTQTEKGCSSWVWGRTTTTSDGKKRDVSLLFVILRSIFFFSSFVVKITFVVLIGLTLVWLLFSHHLLLLFWRFYVEQHPCARIIHLVDQKPMWLRRDIFVLRLLLRKSFIHIMTDER